MPIALPNLMATSPYLYHLTYAPNLERIRRLRILQSTSIMLQAGNMPNQLNQRRTEILELQIGNDNIVITDQHPINENNIQFENNWTLADLVQAINNRVFFWRGKSNGLLRCNQKHFERYQNAAQNLVFLRLSFRSALEINSPNGPQLCKYNSGAARRNNGQRIPRGPRTFVEPKDADFSIGKVKEVVFQNFVNLPVETEICNNSWAGPWQPLFANG